MAEASGKFLLPATASYALVNVVPENLRVLTKYSPVSLLKTVKNSVEIAGMKNAALKDSVAIVDFISFLEKEVKRGKHWDEMKAVETLKKCRSEQKLNRGDSFGTISAVGSNAAAPHYSPSPSTNRSITPEYVYLLDTGGQYLDGTTDITRTFHFGEPTKAEITAYTRVLMGSIDLITAVFPERIEGNDLDILARLPLNSIGLEYNHGTGHGIGHFLSIHEGPIGIGQSGKKDAILKPGMFLSDEPGYYEIGKFGIRLETMMMVVEAATPNKFDDLNFYTFEPVSFVPFEPKFIDFTILSTKQKEWLTWFNAKARSTVGAELRRQKRKGGLQWLMDRTKPIPIQSCKNSAPKTCFQPMLFLLVAFLIRILTTLKL